jgi:RNA polymerase sigma-70 factor (ECF subfamily)
MEPTRGGVRSTTVEQTWPRFRVYDGVRRRRPSEDSISRITPHIEPADAPTPVPVDVDCTGDHVSRFVRLTSPYHDRLNRIALALCHDADQAADLTQEALIRAFRAFDRFVPGQPVLPWLARILRNVHLDSFKTGRARHELAAHQLPLDRQDPLESRKAPGPDPHVAMERSQLRAWLWQEVQALDPGHQLVIILCDIEEFSYQEAADVAGIPVGTVRSRLSRCREHLRRRLEERMHGRRTEPKRGVGRTVHRKGKTNDLR